MKILWKFYVCHSRIVTARTSLVQNIFLSEEGRYFSVLTPKVIDFFGGSQQNMHIFIIIPLNSWEQFIAS